MAQLTKIQASTLVESIVAMVIITISFGVALLIVSNISGKRDPQLNIKAYTEIQKKIIINYNIGEIQEEAWQIEGIKFEQTIIPYNGYDSLCIMEIKAFNNIGKLLIQRKELIRIE